jgi:hypothetical protein
MYVRALQLQRAVVRWTRVVSAFDPLSSGFWTPISSIKAPDDGTSNNTSMYSEHCGTVAPRVVSRPGHWRHRRAWRYYVNRARTRACGEQELVGLYRLLEGAARYTTDLPPGASPGYLLRMLNEWIMSPSVWAIKNIWNLAQATKNSIYRLGTSSTFVLGQAYGLAKNNESNRFWCL